MHKTGSSFEQLLERGFFELCLENDRFWRSRPGAPGPVVRVADRRAGPGGPRDRRAPRGRAGRGRGRGDRRVALVRVEPPEDRRPDRPASRPRASTSRPRTSPASTPSRCCTGTTSARGGPAPGASWPRPEQRAIMARLLGPWLAENGYEADDSLEAEISDAEFLRATRRQLLRPEPGGHPPGPALRGPEGDVPRPGRRRSDPGQLHLLLLPPGLARDEHRVEGSAPRAVRLGSPGWTAPSSSIRSWATRPIGRPVGAWPD